LYQALYRKYRPRIFDDVVGQEHITETLKNQVRSGRLSHAYLFIGTRGTGKTTCAKLLARAVNCKNPQDGNPCNECSSCLGIEDGSILDVAELDAASNNGVDNVRALREEAVFTPATVKKRVYIVDEVHMLSTPAFNALLKILEEPPAHLMFILATTELHKVPATILSRCQRHSFRRIDAETIAQRLSDVAARENILLLPEAARLLGRLSDGSMRDGLSLLDQCSGRERVDAAAVLSAMGLAGTHHILVLLEHIAGGSADDALTLLQQLWMEGREPAAMLGELSSLMRDALMLRLAPKGGASLISGAYDEESLRGLRLSTGRILSGLGMIQAYLGRMRDARSPRMLAELCLIELCGVPTEAPAPEDRREAPPPVQTAAKEKQEKDASVPESAAETAGTEKSPGLPSSEEEPRLTEPEIRTAPAEMAESPVPAAESDTTQVNITWDAILKVLDGCVPVGTLRLLADETQVTASVQGRELLLTVNQGFAMNKRTNRACRLCCGIAQPS
jgi:DNA polymerase-3 subunit gamma/tau